MSVAPDNRTRPFRSITSLLIARIALLAALVTVVLGLGLGAVEYQRTREQRQRVVRLLAQSSLPALSTALWDVETDMVERQIRRIAAIPEVGWAQLQTATGPVFRAGEHEVGDGQVPMLSLPIAAPVEGRHDLGVLEIGLNEHLIRLHTLQRMVAVLGSYALLTACICVLVGWVLRRELQRPLRQIAQFAESLQPGQLDAPLELHRLGHTYRDEIDLVAQGFRHMQHDLGEHIALLDQRVKERTWQLEQKTEEVTRLSLTDALTGCANRRFIDERLPSEVLRSGRYGRPMGVVFVDIDHFKRINDEFGHAAGDEVLRALARVYTEQLRQGIDWIARYGGEEFLIVLPESTAREAEAFAQRLLYVTRAQEIALKGGMIRVTASFGVAGYRVPETTSQLLARVDALLYRAKQDGRDRVCSDLP